MSRLIVFKTAYENIPSSVTMTGRDERVSYVERFTKAGEPFLEESGRSSIRDEVKASFESSLIYSVLDRFEATGDAALLKVRSASYGDFSRVPETMADAVNAADRLRVTYDDLAPEVREKLGSFEEFVKTASSESISSIFNKFKPDPIPAEEEHKDE